MLASANVYAQQENESTSAKATQLEGDINGDGVVDSRDLAALQKIQQKAQAEINKHMSKKLDRRGYKGFVEWGTGFGLGNYDDQFGFDFAVVNGYQFNPYVFAGAGVGYMGFIGTAKGSTDYNGGVPLFADVRATPLHKSVTPLVELRIGGIFGDFSGFYIQPSAGVRFGLSERMGMTLKLAYQNVDYPDGNNFKHNYNGWGTYTASAWGSWGSVSSSTRVYQNWTKYEDRGTSWGSLWLQIGFDW